jgi:hypothetical protein
MAPADKRLEACGDDSLRKGVSNDSEYFNDKLIMKTAILSSLLVTGLIAASAYGTGVATIPPKPAITGPGNNARVTDGSFTVNGTTKANFGVTSVHYTVNGVGPSTATQLNNKNWNNWQAPVVLTQPGSNLFQVWAVGTIGVSLTNSANYFLVVTSPLSITINGTGTVTPNLNGRELVIGETYAITAVAGKGQYFEGWSGSLTESDPKLRFVMQSNMALTATFITNPFTNNNLAGTYDGLFGISDDATETNSGYLTLSLTGSGPNAGIFSGQVWVDGARYSFSDQRFNADGTAQVTLSRRAQKMGDLLLALTLDLNGASGLTGGVSSGGTNGTGEFVSSLQAYRTFQHAATRYEGKYTWAMNGAGNGDATLAPQGYSYGTASVSATGRASLPIMYLADGTQATFAGDLDENGYLPLYVHYDTKKSGSGTVIGWVLFTNAIPTTNYTVSWFKDADTRSASFTNGFSLTGRTIWLAPFKAPGKNTNALDLTNVDVTLQNADLPTPVNYGIPVNGKGVSTNTDNVKLTINNTTGLFTGSFVDPVTSDTDRIQGAVLESMQNGFGYFLTVGDTNILSGSVVLTPLIAILPSLSTP